MAAEVLDAVRPSDQRPRSRLRWVALIAASAFAAAALVAGVTFFRDVNTLAPVAPRSDYTAVSELTGPAVGEALGLRPNTERVVLGCDYFVEYQDGVGFCLDGVTANPVESEVIGLQIQGFERTDALLAYAEANVAYREGGKDTATGLEDRDALAALWSAVVAERG